MDYTINPVVLIVLTIPRMSEPELEWNKYKNGADEIKCINITHYDLMTKTKEILGGEFASPILKELENIIKKKTVVMPESLYIKNKEERIEINKIYDEEFKRRQAIAKECKGLKASDKNSEPIIEFKSCPNNNWLHFRYMGQDDLVIGIMCAYLWDWERYERDSKLRINKKGPIFLQTPVITLFVQVHGNLYREMRRKDLNIENGYEIHGKFCHVIDFDIDMSDLPEKYCNAGELSSFLTKILQDSTCPILGIAERIYTNHILKKHLRIS